jgi:hypothetical protein
MGQMSCFPTEYFMLVTCLEQSKCHDVLDSLGDMFFACLERSKCHDIFDSWDDMQHLF